MSDTPQLLLDAARRTVADRGLAGATSRVITGAAGVNLAAITYHFGSKEALVAEALLSSVREWLDPALEVLRSDLEPTARTMLAVQTLVSTVEAHRGDLAVYLEALAQAPHLPAVGDELRSLWAELRALLGSQVQGMLDRSELPSWVDADAMAGLFVSVAMGLVIQVALDPDGPELAPMASQFASLLIEVRRD